MNLHVLPERTGGAAENMATDFLLLQRYAEPATPRFRHYGWRAAAVTFGYAQKVAFVRSQLPSDESLDLCRRPTGGGIVDHREDWTYALIVPRGHPLEELRASASYREIHEAIADTLRQQGVPTRTQTTTPPSDEPAGVCFERAEVHDVVHATSGVKIAGAAQKRNKHGLLFQGSIWRPAIGATIDWDAFGETLIERLGSVLTAVPTRVPWPEFNEDEVTSLTEQYSSAEWLEFR